MSGGCVQLQRQADIRSSQHHLRRIGQLKLLQDHFISYRIKVEVSVDLLRDIAKELHLLQIATTKRKHDGHITSSVGSGVLGTALVGGFFAGGPVISAGIFFGTVLTAAGTLVLLTAEQKKKVNQLEKDVGDILNSIQNEYNSCNRKLREVCGDDENLGLVHQELVELEALGTTADDSGLRNDVGQLSDLFQIFRNVRSLDYNIRDWASNFPADVREFVENNIRSLGFYITSGGASEVVNYVKGMAPGLRGSPGVTSSLEEQSVNLSAQSSPVAASNGLVGSKKTFFSSCGKFGKAFYVAGAALAAFDLYNSAIKAGELSKKLRRLKDSSDLLKYEGASKDVFNVALDLQVILTTVFNQEHEYEIVNNL